MKRKHIRLLLGLLMVFSLFGCSSSEISTDEQVEQQTADEDIDRTDSNLNTELETWYNDVISATIAKDIEMAMEEIDAEKPTGIELDNVMENDLFTKREYKLQTTGFVYTVYTREWKEGEPEREQYPEEFLTAIGGKNFDDIFWTRE